jgi:hypothetical protein
MAQSTNHFTRNVDQWQSPILIPLVLKLLKKKLNHLEGDKADSAKNISAYHTLYLHWRKNQALDPIQQIWVKEMGGCLRYIVTQSIFNKSSKNAVHSTESREKNSFNL